MKSIVEEASSILKAIEKAWSRAGNPREFSVKVFEDAQKSFFGLTTKQAKVGVFFEIEPIESNPTKPTHTREETPRQKRHAPPSTPHIAGDHTPTQHQQQRATAAHAPRVGTEGAAPEKKKRLAWTDDMLTAVSKWLNDILAISNMGSEQPTLTVLDNRLIITFQKPLCTELEKTADLYRSLSYLLIGMVRSRFKKEFRFLKIVLTDAQRNRDNE